MAAFFPSFRSSSMPKRLLRYALSRLELLDADALDMENLDFALGRNTVLEFRDVGIKLKKLEELLTLPAAFKLSRAKVLLLRVTIPMDLHTSPITVEVDGVEVRIKVQDVDSGKPSHDTTSRDSTTGVPNPVDLAQSFLETQPKSERKQLEAALAADTQDLGASVSISDDGSEDDTQSLGTGQTLSLPDFLTGFLQGIVDRTQIRIRHVTFQLDMDLPAAGSSPATEPVSFRIALESIEVEGVTTAAADANLAKVSDDFPRIVPKEGKRHVSLANVRAYLITEANVFSSLSRSSSMASPSVSSSPTMTRNPPSRQSTSLLSQGSFSEQPMAALQQSFRENLVDSQPPDQDALGDSEEALEIPYEFEDESPQTPRASRSFHQDLLGGLDDSMIGRASELQAALEPAFDHGQLPLRLASAQSSNHSDDDQSSSPSTEDLTESHVYTHQEAESMYMSAFSTSGSRKSSSASRLDQSQTNDPAVLDSASSAEKPTLDHVQTPLVDAPQSPTRRLTMPGAWGEESEAPLESEQILQEKKPVLALPSTSSLDINPPLGDSTLLFAGEQEQPESRARSEQDDAPTPRGPSRVVKELIRLDCVSVHVPTKHNGSPESSLGRMASSMTSLSEAQASDSTAAQLADDAIEIVLSPLSVYFDTSIGLLMAMALDKLLKTVNFDSTDSAKPQPQDEKGVPDLKLSAQEISVNFLSQLRGVADTLDRHLNTSAFADAEDVLLNATLQKLSVSTTRTLLSHKPGSKAEQDATLTRIDVERFRFGYADGDMISFDGGRPLSTSVRDTFLNDGHDIGIKMIRSAGLNTTDVETLPLVIQLDVQRLDETIGWFGGLSSFLNMSASTGVDSPSSPAARPAASTSLPPTRKRPVVHFDAPATRPAENISTSKNKINIRVGGALVELAGRECSVAAETNTIKIVARDEGVGVACSRIRFSGPYLRSRAGEDMCHSHHSAPLVTEVGGLRLELSAIPEDRDLEKLLELIIPSKVKFDDDGSGEIIVETLLRQRRKGSVLRVNIDNVSIRVGNPAGLLPVLPNLGDEVAKLSSTVAAKYLPDDDRPGILILAKLSKLGLGVNVGGKVGHIDAQVGDFEVANITVPSLVAVAVRELSVRRNGTEDLISSEPPQGPLEERNPVVMARIIGDEMEPTVKLKLRDLRIEYRVPTIMDILDMDNETTPQEFEVGLAASVASLADRTLPRREPTVAHKERPTALDIGLRDCLIGLNPLNQPSKLVLALTDARIQAALPSTEGKTTAAVHINKASLLLIDDVSETQTGTRARSTRRRRSSASATPQIASMCDKGFVDICYISSARIAATVREASEGKQVEVEIKDDLLVLETCADSTQTLIALFNGLKPPTPPSKEDKYRTKVVPVQDLLASISAEAFGKSEGDYDFDYDFAGAQEMAGSVSDVGFGTSSQLSPHDGSLMFDAQLSGERFDADETAMQDTAEGVLLTGFDPAQPESVNDSGDDLVIHENFYGRDEASGNSHTAKLWNSVKNTYDTAPNALVKASPFKVSVKDVHVIWNLFDGFDWVHTRDVIAKAVEDVEAKAMERQQLKHSGAEAFDEEEEEEETIGDFLFNSIYIGVPLNRDPRDLTRAINQGLNDADDDTVTETESVATATTARTTGRSQAMHGRTGRNRRLRLNRSKHHKITFELRGVCADVVVYPPPDESGLANRGGQETLSSIDVRVQALDVFDHVPTSTWKKFATYDQDQGEREMGTSMVHLELLMVRPLPDLAASEIVMRAALLPLRLHVDQDALDFITRFFEFKNDDAEVAPQSPNDIPFLQRAEIFDVPVKLDFKPKRVDYAGLRSGHTTEFMNFITLEESRMTLRHVIVYGVSGFDRLGKTLNDIWSPDVRRNQLPGVVAGLAPVRSLVNIGSGFRDLVEIPLKEYQKDGRVIRSISKGAVAFARTTGTELVKLGAKLAVGTQYALQGAEEMLAEQSQRQRPQDEDELTEEDQKQISLYADQPTGVLQGIRGGYRSLTRDVNLARDAIIAVPGEVIGSRSASGAARAVLRRAPTIIFRPAVGVTKVIGQTLLGATNTIDPHNRRRIGEKYKH
ncbi:hypothetical protein HIM_08512 [Hirsutella minnesotensis 3608]|uniref:Autophagy-related protein 2 n=1 Tax=Hirsutella minnesotensis 3608 TaxID=1043627 RepID=A0A0F7ZY90_9HYPO|nr:hypothetical protein HIM_08512 [Hirsutella minnesotensis 3608]